jgi:hypothetical protein
MTDITPNRVNAGKAGAGRFDFKRNSEADIDLVDDESMTVTSAPDYSFETDSYRDWRDEVVDNAPSITTPEEWDSVNQTVSKNLPMQSGEIDMSELDANLQEDASAIKAMDARALRFLGHEENQNGKFSKEYLAGLTDRLGVAVFKNNRDELRKITSPAYDKIEELNQKIAKEPNSPYAVKWAREADASRRTAIAARAEIMRITEEERAAK